MSTPESAVPGTGETPAYPPDPSAGTSNTEVGQGGPPETIPYSRFKEVNDQFTRVKDFAPLVEQGYEPDSLVRLAQFEAAYMQDPTAILAQLVDNVTDLPDEAKAAIKQHLGAETPSTEQATEDTGMSEDGTDPPAWARPLLEDYESRQALREEEAKDQVLEQVLDKWREWDKTDGIDTPERTMLAYITVNAGNGNSIEEIAKTARDDAMGYRDTVLGGTRTTLRGNLDAGSPHPAPGSAGPGASSPRAFKSLSEASAAAAAAIKSGKVLRLDAGPASPE